MSNFGREMESKEEGDDRMRTLDSLRGMLLAERVASKAAKDESQNLAKRLKLLEKELAEEIRWKNRAEKRLKCALERMESLRLLDGFQGSEGSKSDFQKEEEEEEDPGQCRSPGSARGMPLPISGDDLSGGSSPSSLHQQQLASHGGRSWSSAGTCVRSQLEDGGPASIENDGDADLHEMSDHDALRLPCSKGHGEEASMHEADKEDSALALALVPVSEQTNSADDPEPQRQDNVQRVLLALRNVKEQLLHSMQLLADQQENLHAAMLQ